MLQLRITWDRVNIWKSMRYLNAKNTGETVHAFYPFLHHKIVVANTATKRRHCRGSAVNSRPVMVTLVAQTCTGTHEKIILTFVALLIGCQDVTSWKPPRLPLQVKRLCAATKICTATKVQANPLLAIIVLCTTVQNPLFSVSHCVTNPKGRDVNIRKKKNARESTNVFCRYMCPNFLWGLSYTTLLGL